MAVKTLRFLRANVIGCLALFVALSAGAYAANKAPKNSVVTKSIANKAVKTNKLADGAVATGKLADGAVTEAKAAPFTPTTVTAFTNGWVPLPTFSVTYGKDVNGFVHISGRVNSGTQATSAFNLPAGFRPAQTVGIGSGTIFGGNSTPCVISITSGGNVQIGTNAGETGCQPAGSTLLDGIVFKAAG